MLLSAATTVMNKLYYYCLPTDFLVLAVSDGQLICARFTSAHDSYYLQNYQLFACASNAFADADGLLQKIGQTSKTNLPFYLVLPEADYHHYTKTLPPLKPRQIIHSLRYEAAPAGGREYSHTYLLARSETGWQAELFFTEQQFLHNLQKTCRQQKLKLIDILPSLEVVLTEDSADSCLASLYQTTVNLDGLPDDLSDDLRQALATACLYRANFCGFLASEKFYSSLPWKKTCALLLTIWLLYCTGTTYLLHGQAGKLHRELAQKEEHLAFWQYTGQQKENFETLQAERQKRQKQLLSLQQKSCGNYSLCRELAALCPPGIRLENLQRRGTQVLLHGKAEMNDAIETYRHALQNSPCIKTASVSSIKQSDNSKNCSFAFQIELKEEKNG